MVLVWPLDGPKLCVFVDHVLHIRVFVDHIFFQSNIGWSHTSASASPDHLRTIPHTIEAFTGFSTPAHVHFHPLDGDGQPLWYGHQRALPNRPDPAIGCAAGDSLCRKDGFCILSPLIGQI